MAEFDRKMPCPFKEGKFCDGSCENYADLAEITNEVSDESGVGIQDIAQQVANNVVVWWMAPIMMKIFPDASVRCRNSTKH